MDDIESKAIDAAYGDKMKILVGVLIDNYVAAKGDSGKEKTADDAFGRGATLARRVRARAIALLGSYAH